MRRYRSTFSKTYREATNFYLAYSPSHPNLVKYGIAQCVPSRMSTLDANMLGGSSNWEALASVYLGDSQGERYGAGRFEDDFANSTRSVPNHLLPYHNKDSRYSREVKKISQEEALARLYVQLGMINARSCQAVIELQLMNLREKLALKERIDYSRSLNFFLPPFYEIPSFREASKSRRTIWKGFGLLNAEELQSVPETYQWEKYNPIAGHPDLSYL